MTKNYDYAVFIGRFQPFHAGHFEVVKHGLDIADFLIMVIGSADVPRSEHNPWTYSERIEIIKSAVPAEMFERIRFIPANDHPYNDSRWVADIVSGVRSVFDGDWSIEGVWHPGPKPKEPRVVLVGHKKDHTSYYLDMFPMWDSSGVAHYKSLSATDIRSSMYEDRFTTLEDQFFLNQEHMKVIYNLGKSESFREMIEEGKFIKKTKQMWANTPYPVTFVTVDAVVTCAHHVLLIKRRAAPGRGLFAMPGGYLDVNERIVDSMLRELSEETKIAVPKKVLKGSIKISRVYDQVERSSRGRIITHAFHIDLELEPGGKLPKVRGSDDAAKAKWFQLAEFKKMRSVMFEDHHAIITDILNLDE